MFDATFLIIPKILGVILYLFFRFSGGSTSPRIFIALIKALFLPSVTARLASELNR